MSRNLIIVESPAKAKTIKKYLGKDFVVDSSVGHIRDLPAKNLAIDTENDFQPTYVVAKGKQKVISSLIKSAAGCDTVYLAPDPDREGEAIAWHIREVLSEKVKNLNFRRITYNEITRKAVQEALLHPGELDVNRVNAQQARRILDRLVGYKVSPLLWKSNRKWKSAGRVQSVALRLICEREAEIVAFIPEKYWLINVSVAKLIAPSDPFEVRLARINGKKAEVKTQEQCDQIVGHIRKSTMHVQKIDEIKKRFKASPPFITSTLQQAASTVHSFAPSRTMSIAQGLYEGIETADGPAGLITYMRTDSVAIASEAQNACAEWISDNLGSDYLPPKPNIYKSKASAQEAHEAIRPTDVTRTPESLAPNLTSEQLKLYTLIWKRFVASQMAPAINKIRTIQIETDPSPDVYQFSVSVSQEVFPGFRKVYDVHDQGKEKDKDEKQQNLPPLEKGEELKCLDVIPLEKETKPPSRFSEASLIRQLEENGIGRPSTYASIINTLKRRDYIKIEKRSIRPTDTGINVNTFLVQNLDSLFNVSFTADMEKKLDQIETGKTEWVRMLHDFYDPFVGWLESAKPKPPPTSHVERLLRILSDVKDWKPPQKIGRRTYNDQKFVESVRTQFEKGERPVSERQLTSLVRLALGYKDQLPDVEQQLDELGLSELIRQKKSKEPAEVSQKKVKLAAGLSLKQSTGKFSEKAFIESLASKVESGAGLSDKQIAVLDRILTKYHDQIPDYDDVREELGLPDPESVRDDEGEALINMFKSVSEWGEPVQRGKRTFDDKAFYKSLCDQFVSKRQLSNKQKFALKKLACKYRQQIPGFDELAGNLGIKCSGDADKQ